jgi:carbon storage regulator
MLVLSRQTGEKLIIGNDIEVIILEVKGNQVRAGIDAREEVPTVREELLEIDEH